MADALLGLVLTGGTVGSTSAADDRVVRLVRGPGSGGVPGWMAGPLAAFGPHRLLVRRPVSLHSEEARPRHWEAIAEACRELAGQGVRAIVVLHGSDTMGHTAAALSFELADLEVPVALTGSNLPPDAERSDAAWNVTCALTALRRLPSGVYLVFAGTEGIDADVHLGTRVHKVRASGRAFFSPNGGPVATVRGRRLETLRRWPAPQPLPGPVGLGFDPAVLLLRQHPGLPYEALEPALGAGVHGVVVELYPCATGPTGFDATSLERFARAAARARVAIAAVVGAAPAGPANRYPSLGVLAEAGIAFLPGILPETALVKLMWALRRTRGDADRATRLLRRPVAGEAWTGEPANLRPAPAARPSLGPLPAPVRPSRG